MKFEKINENQIRCILNQADLSERNIEMKELSYGSLSARNLFHEMMTRANQELGFDVENTPLMVEAIPLSTDSIMLIITKVENPEELDARYSRFTPTQEDDFLSDLANLPMQILEGAAKALQQQLEDGSDEKSEASDASSGDEFVPIQGIRIFRFESLPELARAAASLTDPDAVCYSTLYRTDAEEFHLVVFPKENMSTEYCRVCNVLSEFANRVPATGATAAYLNEHFPKLMEFNALSRAAAMAK